MESATHQTINISPLKSVLQFYLAYFLWGPAFSGKRRKLAKHRVKIIDKISMIPFNRLPSSLKAYLKVGVIRLEQAYNEAFQWKKIYRNFKPLNLLNNDVYFVARYITVEGNFNHFDWVKNFIHDTERDIVRRFKFACCYCLEDEILTLWKEIKARNEVNDDNGLSQFVDNTPHLVDLWIETLENALDKQVKDPSYNMFQFWYYGLLEAVESGYEHATYYFWQLLPDRGKNDLIRSKELFRAMMMAAQAKYHKIIYFLYCQLSYQQKCDLLAWNMYISEPPSVWCCLLESPFTHDSILQELRSTPYDVTDEIGAYILDFLVLSLKELRLPMFRRTFLMLWQKVPKEKQNYVLQTKEHILVELVEAKELDTAGLIIKGMSVEQKEKCLFDDWNGAGIFNLRVLSSQKEYTLLQKYFSFFLIEFDATTRIEVVREDALTVLQTFVHSPSFESWTRNLPETEKIEVNKTFDALQSSLVFIKELLISIENSSCPLFLPSNERVSRLEQTQENSK